MTSSIFLIFTFFNFRTVIRAIKKNDPDLGWIIFILIPHWSIFFNQSKLVSRKWIIFFYYYVTWWRHCLNIRFRWEKKKRVLPLIFPAERSSFLGPLNLIRALVTFKGTFTVKGSMDSRERFPSCICSLKLTNSILLFLGKSKKYRENK